jgi:hypothetical protein
MVKSNAKLMHQVISDCMLVNIDDTHTAQCNLLTGANGGGGGGVFF